MQDLQQEFDHERTKVMEEHGSEKADLLAILQAMKVHIPGLLARYICGSAGFGLFTGSKVH